MASRFPKRFSLRALLAATAVIAAACGVVAYQLALIRAEHAAAGELSAAVERDMMQAGETPRFFVLVGRDPPTTYLSRLLYRLASSPGQVRQLRVVGEGSLQALKNRIGSLPQLEWLEMSLQARNGDLGLLTQEYIAVAANFPSLERLVLRGQLSEDLDIAVLRTHHIEEIHIDSPMICDNVIRDLASLDTLSLNISCESYDRTIPAAAFASFGASSIKHLCIVGAAIDDQGLQYISRIPNLGSLDIEGANISDQGLISASKHLHVYDLDLGGTGITDNSVETLAAMKDLSFVDVRHTNISREGLARLKALRADLNVQ